MTTLNPQGLDRQTLSMFHRFNVSQREILESAIAASKQCIEDSQTVLSKLQAQLDELVTNDDAVRYELALLTVSSVRDLIQRSYPRPLSPQTPKG
jgi:hypothetical protein